MGTKAYPDSNIRRRNKTDQCCRKEYMKWYINNGRRQIDEKIWQGWCYPQEKHVIQQLIPTLCYLI